jgi:hypothetical protein
MDDLMTRSELTVAECDELRSMALAMPVENIPVETRELAKQLQFIEATLSSKNTDEQSGQMRTAVYARILGGYTKEALSYMTERVCKELDWFPTPRQCLQILESYTPRTSRKGQGASESVQITRRQGLKNLFHKLHCGEPVKLDRQARSLVTHC